MHRRTLFGGLALAGTAVFSTPPGAVAPLADSIGALESALLDPPTATGNPVTLPQLRRAVNAARSVFQHGRYTEVAERLPELVSTARVTRAVLRTCEDIGAFSGQLAEIYTLASELMIKFGHDHLAWTTADRALQAAYGSGDVLIQASARRTWGIVLRRADRAETA